MKVKLKFWTFQSEAPSTKSKFKKKKTHFNLFIFLSCWFLFVEERLVKIASVHMESFCLRVCSVLTTLMIFISFFIMREFSKAVENIIGSSELDNQVVLQYPVGGIVIQVGEAFFSFFGRWFGSTVMFRRTLKVLYINFFFGFFFCVLCYLTQMSYTRTD